MSKPHSHGGSDTSRRVRLVSLNEPFNTILWRALGFVLIPQLCDGWLEHRKWHQIPEHLTQSVNLSETEAIALIARMAVPSRRDEGWANQRLIGLVFFTRLPHHSTHVWVQPCLITVLCYRKTRKGEREREKKEENVRYKERERKKVRM